MDNDTQSVFSYDGEGEPDAFNLSRLNEVVDRHFGGSCQLKKLNQGGYHKVYDIIFSDGTPLDAVVRVACPAFPTDKLESEVATYKYLNAYTTLPLPEIYAWDSNSRNTVGAEYMIMQKIPGTPAGDVWDNITQDIKTTVVIQVAKYLMEIFRLRFTSMGSLYWTPERNDFHIGPIISIPYYRALDGRLRIVEDTVSRNTHPNRGPFSTVSDYLSNHIRTELSFISDHRSIVLSEVAQGDDTMAESRLKDGVRTLEKAVELCSVYPGDLSILKSIKTLDTPFSIKLDDFSLNNIMIDEKTGQVTGFIDFEGTTIAPLWNCALVPPWIQLPCDREASYAGGSVESRTALLSTFLDTVDSADHGSEWREAYETGRPFRELFDFSIFQVNVWLVFKLERWVDKCLEWAKMYPGVGFPDDENL